MALTLLFMAMRVRGRILGRGRVWAPLVAALLLHAPAEQAAAGALERAMLGKAPVVDLAHPIAEDRASAGTEHHPPEAAGEAERPGGQLATHLDAPSTFIKGKPTVARIPLQELLVQAVVIDAATKVAAAAEYRVGVEDLQAWERRHGRIPRRSLVLLCTGWDRRWHDPARYLNQDAQGVAHVPGFSRAALAFLALERDVWGVGLDAFTPNGPAGNGEAAQLLLQAGKYRIENLTNLDKLPAKGAKLVIAPLPVEAPSAPVRVIAILP